MQSVHSYFSSTLYRKSLLRFWPIFVAYFATLFFLLPGDAYRILQFSSGAQPLERAKRMAEFANAETLRFVGDAGVVVAVLFGVLVAMAMFSYLYQSRSAGMMHALPLRREGLFLTNYLAGLTMFVGGNGLIFLITLGMEAAGGAANGGALFMWFCAQTLLCFFFYSFAVFCAMFTGNIFALPVFYGILNFLVMGLDGIIREVFFTTLPGYYPSAASPIVEVFCPASFLIERLYVREVENGVLRLMGMESLLAYGLVALVLLAAAVLLYRKRHVEGAGDVVAVGWVRPIFKYGVAVCSALTLGTLLYAWLGKPNKGSGVWGLLPFLLVCGTVGYFAAEMLLQKSFRVFPKWKGCAVFLAVILCLTATVGLDLVGYGRVPEDSAIAVATILRTNGASRTGQHSAYSVFGETSPEGIAKVTDIHRAILAWRKAHPEEETREGGDGDEWNALWIDLEYTLKSGRTITRRYETVFIGDEITQGGPKGLPELLQNYLDSDLMQKAQYAGFREEKDENLTGVSMTRWSREDWTFSTSQGERLLTAAREDLAAGRIGRMYLYRSEAMLENSYANELVFSFKGKRQGETSYRAIRVQKSATSTLRVLEELGVAELLVMERD